MRPFLAARALALGAALCCAPSPAFALAKVEGETRSLELTGNVRLLAGFLHFTDDTLVSLGYADDGIAAAVGRLIFKGALATDVDYEIHGFLDIGRSPSGRNGAAGASTGTFSTAGSFITPYRTRYLAWSFWQNGSDTGSLGIDRISLHARVGVLDITAGRFPINDSVAHLFTVNDFFAPFSATAINKAYKPGVDAVRLTLALGRLSAIEVRGVLGSDVATGVPSWAESALTLRANTVLAGFDFAVVAGKLAERWVAGGTFQGSLGPIDLRGEGHVGVADKAGEGAGFSSDAKVHGRVAAGLSWRSTWHNAIIDAEYAWFSNGASTPAGYRARALSLFPDELPYYGEHYAGLGAGMEILPILRVNVLGMVNLLDASGLAVASLAYDISDESACSVGLLVPWGRGLSGLPGLTPQSEFGVYPVTLFAESRFYF